MARKKVTKNISDFLGMDWQEQDPETPEVNTVCDFCGQEQNRKKLDQQKASRAKVRSEGRCVNCYKSNDRMPRTLCSTCQAKKEAYGQKLMLKLKLETFAAYGGVFCSCCGETELDFLTLDHEDGNGRKVHNGKKGRSLYSWLRARGFPKSPAMRVLCFNCNSGRQINGGICPHNESDRDVWLSRLPGSEDSTEEQFCPYEEGELK